MRVERTPPRILLFVLLVLPIVSIAGCSRPVPTLEESRRLLAAGEPESAMEIAAAVLDEQQLPAGQLAALELLDEICRTLPRSEGPEGERCLAWARRRLDTTEGVPGAAAADLLPALVDLARQLQSHRLLEEQERALQRVLVLAEQSEPAPSETVGDAHNRLGNFYHHQRADIAASRRHYESALGSYERVLGVRHLKVGRTVHNVAIAQWALGDLEAALVSERRALALLGEAQGQDHADVAVVLDGVGGIQTDLGRYEDALASYETAADIRLRQLGPEHRGYADAIHNLGWIRAQMGDWAAAAPRFGQALELFRKLDPEDLVTAIAAENLAEALAHLGRVGAALETLEAAIAIHRARTASGTSDRRLAMVLAIRGSFEKRVGDLVAAERSLTEAVRRHEEGGDGNDPWHALALEELAELLLHQERVPEARELLVRSDELRRRVLGDAHPSVARSEALLAEAALAAGNVGEALQRSLHAEELGRSHLVRLTRALGHRQALRYAAERERALDVALRLAAAGALVEVQAREVWDAALRSRGVVLDEMAARYRTLGESGDPGLVELRRTLARAQRRLTRLAVEGMGREELEESFAARFQAALDLTEELERRLAAASSSFSDAVLRGRRGLAEIAGALPEGAALLSYFRFGESRWGESAPRYLAFLLRASDQPVEVFDLGPAGVMDRGVQEWLDQLSPDASGNVLASRAEREREYRRVGQRLRAAIWDPLAVDPETVAQIFVVPSGALHLVSLASLPVGESSYLVERGPRAHYLSSEAGLLRQPRTAAVQGTLLAVGDPAFGGPREGWDEVPTLPSTKVSRALGCLRGSPGELAPLPAARREVLEVAELWGRSGERSATVVTGAEATEELLKHSAGNYEVLHLATHALFASPDCREHGRGTGDAGTAALLDNPLLLSGLALAGIADIAGAGDGSGEDGLLSAEEISSLDLSGTDWVVLSACETGVGDTQIGEGVLGLRRAFEIAGARTLLLSLWRVGDEDARAWMQELYTQRNSGRDTAVAVQGATLQRLQTLRASGRSTHPVSWAAFVATGDWR